MRVFHSIAEYSSILSFVDLSILCNITHAKQSDGLRLGIIIAGLVSILSTKFLSDKRLEFFRESSSGYNVNAYYLALNITSTLEISVVMVIIGMCANAIVSSEFALMILHHVYFV